MKGFDVQCLAGSSVVCSAYTPSLKHKPVADSNREVDCLDARLSISPPHKVRPSSENHLIWGHDLESKDDNSKTTSRALLGVASHMYIYIYTHT